MIKTIQRFWAKIEYAEHNDDECWYWVGSINHDGYGQFGVNCKYVRVHRYIYEEFRGPIPKGLVIDHLCRNRGCVNPQHLEPVTHKENCRRGSNQIRSRKFIKDVDKKIESARLVS